MLNVLALFVVGVGSAAPVSNFETLSSVLETQPLDAATGVGIYTNIVVVYNQTMNISVEPTLIESTGSPAAPYNFLGWSTTYNASDTAMWNHTNPWPESTLIVMNVSGGEDMGGQPGDLCIWNFTTGSGGGTPNITVEKTVNRTSASPGDNLQYDIYFNNTGDANATNVWVNDTLPPEVTYISDSAAALPCYSDSSIVGQIHYFTFTNVASGDYSFVITVQIDAGVSNGTILTNNVTCEYEPSGVFSIDWADTAISIPNINVEKTVNKATVSPEETLTYTIYYNNTGSGTATDVWINDTLPSEVVYIADSSGEIPTNVGNNFSWHFASVGPGPHSFTIWIQINAGVPDGTIPSNWVTCEYEPSGVYSEDWANTTVIAPVIAIEKVVDKGTAASNEFLNYTIWFNNTGGGSSDYVWVNDTLPGNVTYVSDTASLEPSFNGSWNDGITWYYEFCFVPPGVHSFVITVQIDAGVSDGTILTNWATCEYEPSGVYTEDWAETTIGVVDEAPTIISTSPSEGELDVSINSNITVLFSEPMNQTSVENAFHIYPNVNGTFSWNATGDEMTFTPDAVLEGNRTYLCHVDLSAEDLAGNFLISKYGAEFHICTLSGHQMNPDIFGNKVVWGDWRNGNGDIFIYNLDTEQEEAICTDPEFQGQPAIYENWIVWQDERGGSNQEDIYLYNISSGVETPICTASGRQSLPKIYNDIVVWQDNRYGNYDIFMYNITNGTESPVIVEGTDQSIVTIYENLIVWRDSRNGNNDIFMYNISTGIEIPICINASYLSNPRIYGNYIVWEEYDPFWVEPDKIYLYEIDTGNITLISSYPDSKEDLDIWEDLVVWVDYRNGDKDIFAYDINFGEEYLLINHSVDDREPEIYGNYIVYDYYVSGNSDIYLNGLPYAWTFTTEDNIGPVHNLNTSEDFPTIQEAIDDTDTLEGHTLSITFQNYPEEVNVYKDITFIGEANLTGNLTVDSGGNLTLKNFTLLLNCAIDGEYKINVTENGELNIINDTNITAVNASNRYKFEVRGSMVIDHSIISRMWTGLNPDYPQARGGIQIFSDDVVISNSSIYNNGIHDPDATGMYASYGLFIHNSSPIIETSLIQASTISSSYECVSIYNSSAYFYGNTIKDSQNSGIKVRSSSPIIMNNTFDYTGIDVAYVIQNLLPGGKPYYILWAGGISLMDSSATIQGNDFYRNGNGIFAWNSTGEIIGNYFEDNGPWGWPDESINNTNAKLGYGGMSLYDSNFTTISNNTIIDSMKNGIGMYYTSGTLENNTISNTDIFDIDIDGNSQVQTLNTTFNKTRVLVEEYANLSVNWFLDIEVVDESGNLVPNAEINIQENSNGSFDENLTADGEGEVKWVIVTEKIQNATTNISHTPHIITAMKDSKIGYAQPMMDESKKITVTIRDITNPVADAGPDQWVDKDTMVYLDGSGSTDNVGVVNYTWTFDDKGTVITLYGVNASYLFTQSGSYIVILTVADAAGNWNSDSCFVNVTGMEPPVAIAEPPHQSVTIGQNASFFGNLSYDPDGTIVSYFWEFGDGSNGTGAFVQHAYAISGNYTVTLTATDNDGLTDTDTCTVYVTGLQSPVAIAAPDFQGLVVGETGEFYGNMSYDPDGTIVGYSWNFGDGFTGTEMNPTHIYTKSGYYTVTLTVTDNDGLTDTDTCGVNVTGLQSPVAVAEPDYQEQLIENAAIFDGSLSFDPDGTVVSYLWDYGDGESGTGAVQAHLYAAPGNYTVTLTVTDNDGLTDTDICVVIIKDIDNPVISDVVVVPSEPNNRAVITIVCKVTDNVEVASVTLTYLHNGINWTTLLMGNDVSDVYHVNFGPVNQSFPYFINATDTSGNMATYFGNVTVKKAQIEGSSEGLGPDYPIESGSTVTITGTVSIDGEANSTGIFIAVVLNGEIIEMVPVQEDGSFILEFTIPTTEEEDSILELELVDKISGEVHILESRIIPGTGASSFPWFFLMFGSAIAGSVALGLATEVGKFALLMLFIPLYTKIKKDDVLDLYTRGKIHGYILANPGDHYNAIKRALNMNNGSLAYHLSVLKKEGLIKSQNNGQYKRFYPMDFTIPNGGPLTPSQTFIMSTIEETPGISQKGIAGVMGVSPSTVNYHMQRLIELNMIRSERRGMKIEYYKNPVAMEDVNQVLLSSTTASRTEPDVVICPKCEFEIEDGKPCPFCEDMPEIPEPPKPPVTRPKMQKVEILAKLEKAYKDGKLTEEQYHKNIEKFG